MNQRKRLVVIEEGGSQYSPAKAKIIESIHSIKSELSCKVDTFEVKKDEHLILDKFDKLIQSRLIDGFDLVMTDLDSIQKVFDKLKSDLVEMFQEKKLLESHKPIYSGLNSILNWCQLIFVEKYIQIPLASELSNNDQEEKTEIAKKKEQLYNTIANFNKKISEQESQFKSEVFPKLSFDQPTLQDVFNPLLKEDRNYLKLIDSPLIRDLTKERNQVELDLIKLTQEIQEMMDKFNKQCVAERDARCKLYDSDLDIDVYYLADFKENEKYKNLFNKEKKAQVDKVIFIKELIKKVNVPYKDLISEVDSYYKFTSYSFAAVTNYRQSVNAIHNLLLRLKETFKIDPRLDTIDKEYDEVYKHIVEDLSQKYKEVQQYFVTSAKTYLQSASKRTWRSLAALREQADINFENEVKRYNDKIQLDVDKTQIQANNIIEIKKTTLNTAWRDSLCQCFINEIELINKQYNQLKADKSDAALAELKQSRKKLSLKKDDLLKYVINSSTLKNRLEEVMLILNEVYDKACKDSIFVTIDNAIAAFEQTKISEEKKSIFVKLVETKKVGAKSEPIPANSLRQMMSVIDPTTNRLSPPAEKPQAAAVTVAKVQHKSASKFIFSQSWKNAFWIGLGVFALVCLALTGWGFIAQLSALAVVAAIGGSGGVVGITLGSFIVGTGGYFSWQFRNHSKVIAKDVPTPAPVPAVTLVQSQKQSSSYQRILTSPIGKPKSLKDLAEPVAKEPQLAEPKTNKLVPLVAEPEMLVLQNLEDQLIRLEMQRKLAK